MWVQPICLRMMTSRKMMRRTKIWKMSFRIRSTALRKTIRDMMSTVIRWMRSPMTLIPWHRTLLPSGVLEPSGDDMLVTKRIIEAGKIMNIPVIDHLIVAGGSGRFYSFRENHPDMFNVTVTEAVREAQSRDSGRNVAGDDFGAIKASNKAYKTNEQARGISNQGQSDHKTRIREKLQEYRPLAKVEELLEENYNQIDNQLSNTSPGDDAAEKRRKESRKIVAEQGASDKKASMKQRLLERQRQVAQQSPPKESKPKHEVREL